MKSYWFAYNSKTTEIRTQCGSYECFIQTEFKDQNFKNKKWTPQNGSAKSQAF